MNRDRSIDFMKTILVFGMIEAHVIQFLGDKLNKLQYINSMFINLITFSGFMFCFGYVSNIVYLKKADNGIIKQKLLKNFIRILISFYISGIAYTILVEKKFSMLELMKIIFLFKIPGYSEFLITFAILNLVTLAFLKQINYLLENKKALTLVIIISILATFIPYQLIKFNQLGLFIGNSRFSCFPLLQYSSYFLIGAYFSRNRLKYNLKILFGSCTTLSLFVLYVLIYKKLPSRFPPEALWILGGSFFIYMYYLISLFLAKKIKNNFIYFLGENSLDFLILSNIFLFLVYYFYGNLNLSFINILIMTLIIIFTCYIIIYIKVILSKLRNVYTI
ncbi:hypothetical protein P5F61_08120 [Clostridium perfringens]|nr:hypothetical protein [Clostridium perfringens]HAT4257873.1 acyltransferase [Clostridium perfringens]